MTIPSKRTLENWRYDALKEVNYVAPAKHEHIRNYVTITTQAERILTLTRILLDKELIRRKSK